MCENCGWQALCPHCDVPLTYHGDHHELRCHSCNYHAKAPSSCPECKHANIMFKTAGTKAIVDEITRLFPHARVARFDTDNARAERFEQHYEAVSRGEVDILVGTQLLAKGLDLPRLSTWASCWQTPVSICPIFRRRNGPSAHQPGHQAGSAAAISPAAPSSRRTTPIIPYSGQPSPATMEGFYKSELVSREQFMFPPFCYLLKLTVRRASIAGARSAASFKRKYSDQGRMYASKGRPRHFMSAFRINTNGSWWSKRGNAASCSESSTCFPVAGHTISTR